MNSKNSGMTLSSDLLNKNCRYSFSFSFLFSSLEREFREKKVFLGKLANLMFLWFLM